MNQNQFTGKWKQLRGQIRVKWGQITENELDQIAGNFDMLVGKIQERYGGAREEIEREIEALTKDEPVTTLPMSAGKPAQTAGAPGTREGRKSR